MPRSKRIVNLRSLPGEPLDGTGRVCVHLFVQDERGPFIEPSALHPVFENGQQVKQRLDSRPTRGRLACDPKRSAVPVTTSGNITTVTFRTDEPRAVSCQKCKASKFYIDLMTRIAQAEGSADTKETSNASSPSPADQRPIHRSVERLQPGNAE